MSLRIIGTGIGLPKNSFTNDELSEFVETSDEWITSRTGIKSRYICVSETVTDIASEAASKALRASGISASELGYIFCATIGGDYTTPSLACAIAERIGAVCPAVDLNAACTGFLYALDLASCYLDLDRAKYILIVSCERMSSRVDWRDRSTCVLFGDGAGACVTTKGTALKYMRLAVSGGYQTLTQQSQAGNCPFTLKKEKEKENENDLILDSQNDGHIVSAQDDAQQYLKMDGQAVFKFACKAIEHEIRLALKAMNIQASDVDYFLVHQANSRILDYARNKLNQPLEKFPMNISRYGNMSAATIPILMSEMLDDGAIKTGNLLVLSAFGAGMTQGAGVMIWE